MKEYRLERDQWIPVPLDEVFRFFSDARNLAQITPSWLGFRIHEPIPEEVREGTRIDYTIRIAGLPVRWRTRIDVWDPPHHFVDLQERGPYALWEHTHEFRPQPGGVLMTDRVRYALPAGPIGRALHWLLVRAMLARIFDYRFDHIRRAFPEGAAAPRIARTG